MPGTYRVHPLIWGGVSFRSGINLMNSLTISQIGRYRFSTSRDRHPCPAATGPERAGSLGTAALESQTLSAGPEHLPGPGIPIRSIFLSGSPVRSLCPVLGNPVRSIFLSGNQERDHCPVRGSPVRSIFLSGSQERDLCTVRGSPVRSIFLSGSPERSLCPVRGSPVRSIFMSGSPVRSLCPVRGSLSGGCRGSKSAVSSSCQCRQLSEVPEGLLSTSLECARGA
jgi:hypothetical protein